MIAVFKVDSRLSVQLNLAHVGLARNVKTASTPFIQVIIHEGSPEGIRVSMEERICEMKEMSVKYGVKGRGSDM